MMAALSRLVLLIFFASGALACAPRPDFIETIRLDTATLRLDDASIDSGTSHPQELPLRALPDAWSRGERARARRGTYRLTFQLDAIPAESWVLYLPAVRMNVVARVNGRAVGNGGRIIEPVARNWNRPLLMTVPTTLLRSGANSIELDIYASESTQPRLGHVFIGPARELIDVYELDHARRITARWVGIGLLTLIAVGTGILVGGRVAPSSAIWIGASALLVALGQLDGVVRDIPVSTSLWQWANTTAYLAAVVCFTAGIHRITGIAAPRFEMLLGGAALLLSLATWLAPPLELAAVAGGVLQSCSIVVAYLLIQALRSGTRAIRLAVGSFCAAILGAGAIGVLSVIGILVAMVTGWMLLVYFREVLDRTETLNAELDRRINAREIELAESHQRMLALTEQQTLASERERLTREMHDGLGAMLVSTLAMVESGDLRPDLVAQALREVLEEMRLMLDALEPSDGDLGAAMGQLRDRLRPRLERYGLTMNWEVATDLARLDQAPAAVHHVMRILQEGITNVIRHADAKAITVRARNEHRAGRSGLALELLDDGRGLPTSAHASLRGLSNMRRRAEDIGAVLELAAEGAGTSIRLWLPRP